MGFIIGFLKGIRKIASGKKTYAIGLLMIALGILNGDNVLIVEGVALCTLRAGISK